MANAAQHAGLGAIAGGSAYLVMCKYYSREPKLGELLACTGAAVLVAALPDVIEPATHPHHRQSAHSLVLGTILAKFGTVKCGGENSKWGEFQKIFVAVLIVAYLSHLLADAFTPRGLPLLGS